MNLAKGQIEQRLEELGFTLPQQVKSAGNYVLAKEYGNLLYLSGVTCKMNGQLMLTGKLGEQVTIEDAQQAAQLCTLNHLSIVRNHLENLDQVDQIIKLVGYVNCVGSFPDMPKILDAASSLLIDVFGEKGQHTRSAIGVQSLPGNATIETELLIALRDS